MTKTNKYFKNKHKKQVVICGSMSNYNQMLDCQRLLKEKNIPSIVPQKDCELIEELSPDKMIEKKQELSRKHFQEICDDNVFAILVVNSIKNQLNNYIGANTFAEIAIAFCCQRRIFLLYDIYEKFKDELIAWQTQPLQGDLNKLVDEYYSSINKNSLSLFRLTTNK